MKKFIAFTAVLLFTSPLFSQTLRGRVYDLNSKEAIENAAVIIEGSDKGTGTTTNSNGEFTLSGFKANATTVNILIRHIGYKDESLQVNIANTNFVEVPLKRLFEFLEPVSVSAIRASENAPIAKTDLNEEEIEKRDDGRDVPFILKDLPSTVVSSDAGTGIGYTGIRIRGSDISRINVTVNGIPLNDPESHGVFWVNTPDLISSTNSLQVQRGVGTSTNGAGAFGASINMKTNEIKINPFAETEITAGSFNTFKRNLQVGSGLLNKHWIVEGRLSQISSDGFIDRAHADLTSYYLSGSYYSENTSVQLIHFGGKEKTYQAWWGVPEVKLNNDSAGMAAYVYNNGLDSAQAHNLFTSDPRTYNYYMYENEVDNYQQDHYQLHFSHRFNPALKVNAALHYTWGRGYYEQYRKDDDLADYNLSDVIVGNDTISSTDLIRRRWLNNNFSGATYSIEYNENDINLTLGGAYNTYVGDHYGEIIWARFASNSEIRDRYYDNRSIKNDFNNYLKANYTFGKWSVFADLQFRNVKYTGEGIDNDQRLIDLNREFNFFNPKAGLNYALTKSQRIYFSAGVGQREPVRSDFLDAPLNTTPRAEKMIDYEAGYSIDKEKLKFNANLFYMDYTDQLVLTGQLNDVGSPLRTNVAESYRRGIEISGAYKINNWFNIGGNLALSQNKILDYEEYTIMYDEFFGSTYYDTLKLDKTDISFSPSVIGGIYFNVMPFKDLSINWNTKYVGRQYLDNTSSISKSLDPFTVTDIRVDYTMSSNWFSKVNFHLLVSNLFSTQYSPNGYTYSWGYDYRDANNDLQKEVITDNHYFPMAGINFLGGVKIAF